MWILLMHISEYRDYGSRFCYKVQNTRLDRLNSGHKYSNQISTDQNNHSVSRILKSVPILESSESYSGSKQAMQEI